MHYLGHCCQTAILHCTAYCDVLCCVHLHWVWGAYCLCVRWLLAPSPFTTSFRVLCHNTMCTSTQFLRAFEKLRKATVVASYLSVRSDWRTRLPLGRIFMKFDIWGFSENLPIKFKFWLKTVKNNSYITWRPVCIVIISRCIRFRVRNVSEKSCRWNPNTNVLFGKIFSLPKVVALCQVMWSSMVDAGRSKVTDNATQNRHDLHAG
jgi:hypothetical protein